MAETPRRPKARVAAAHFPVVAIGASAGGFEALEQFFGQVPALSGMAYIIIQHLDPTYRGIMPELLQRGTPLPVMQARNHLSVLPDHVYVIPPNKDLSILHGVLHLLDPVAPRGLRLPIDFFFRTLADDIQNYAVGVILSGMGSDGSLGVRAIKENGGLVLVQDPSSSKFDSMPQSAIDTGMVDVVATADQLPKRIAECLHHVGVPSPENINGETETQRSGFDNICILLRTRTGHDFSSYKKSTVYRRIERRMAIHQLGRMVDYVRYLRENVQEIDLLFKELLIGVTSFFRDPATWATLKAEVLPELFAGSPEGGVLRAWVAGCSTGEEAYTLAIIFREALEEHRRQGKFSLQIFATDLDSDAIEKARQGIYPANIVADVEEARLKRYFIEEGKGYRIGKEIREMVVFAPQNVAMDPPFTRLDILTCRNLLIYLNTELQKKLLPLFYYSLRPGGILLLGSAETVGGHDELFLPLDAKARLFRRNSAPIRALDVVFPTRYPPTHLIHAMNTTTEPAPLNVQILVDQLVQQKFAPAAVLVNASGDLIYVSGRTGKYLEPASGKVNWNIHAMAREGLRQEIAIALPKALRSNHDIVCRHVDVIGHSTVQRVNLTVHPVQEAAELGGMALLVFADVEMSEAIPDHGSGATIMGNPRARELKSALNRAQLEMKSLQEEMQISQEELKSINEELQSTNEELQSTNEELTTSKEEMQSLNEELQTVNIELQSKVDELSVTNNDMKNLLNSTDIATIFLDNTQHVRRFTSQATRLYKLIPGDVGRLLSDIVTDLVYPSLLRDVEEVLRTLVYSDKEIETIDGRWFQVKIMPYRTLDNVIDGVVLTFNDVSQAKQLEAKLRQLSGGS
ncbi:MAG: chemotaxis protein CheB [Ferrovum sp.]|nr:chemotaxis protein CheB [Ferrovum sp.]NDU86572.1 chemotaxis protein CheB [Ferrovum sp.]